MNEPSGATSHSWRFSRVGGIDQVHFTSAEDLLAIDRLDQKLWMALSLPVKGVVFDRATLELIDSDKDGRVRVTELIAAVQWARQHLKTTTDLFAGGKPLLLASIDDRTEAGKKLIAAAKRILLNLNRPNAPSLSVDDIADPTRIFAGTKLNGDGVVTAESTDDEALKVAIGTIIETHGGEPDRSGKLGVNQAKVDAFFTEAQALADWTAKEAATLVLAERTPKAHAAWAAVKAKAEDYFLRARVASFDARAEGPMNGTVEAFTALAAHTLETSQLKDLPLAHVQAARPLPLTEGISPAYSEAIAAFRGDTVIPLLGERTQLSEADWRMIEARLQPHASWLAAKPTTKIAGLEPAKRAALTADTKAKLSALIALDLEVAPETAEIDAAVRLVRYHRDLKQLLENYVNFADFYRPHTKAIFQIGSLYLDARAADLCVAVDDIGKHAGLASASKMFLAYCEITRVGGEKKNICAAFTAGMAESLWVGRNGIFFDRDGKDWDAVIVKVVEAQISLKEAFWSPWRTLSKMIGEQLNKLLAAKDTALQANAQKSFEEASKVAAASGQPPPTAPIAAPVASAGPAAMASAVAAIGIGLGFLSTAVAGFIGVVTGTPLWKTVLGLVGLMLLVSGPSMAIAYFKLRSRDLAAILNAGGWAINGQIKLSLTLGRKLTREAVLPDGAERQLTDPYADDHSKRNFLIFLGVIVALVAALWYLGALEHYFPMLPDPPTDAPKIFHDIAPAP